jgi:hypothetical protein
MRCELRLLLLLVAVFLVPACSGPRTAAACSSGERERDAACAAAAMRRHPAVWLRSWRGALQRPLEDRIGPAPPVLLDYLLLDNLHGGFPNRPRPAELSPDFVADSRAALAELPEPVKRLIERKLVGIYIVDDLGGSGYTEQLLDEHAMPVAGLVVLDSSVLRWRGANQWASWKEGTPFKADPRFSLGAEIESAAGDSRKNAIQYILLHELGHVVAIGSDVHPSWRPRPGSVQTAAAYPFFALSWQVSPLENRYVTRFDAEFPQRRDLVYYFGARLPASAMAATYDRLEHTSFPTLYAATNPFDDFAESFANYVHVVLMQRPFWISILADGKPIKTYGACWEQRRCAAKRAIIEDILAAKAADGAH